MVPITPLDDAPEPCRLSARALVEAYATRTLSPVEAVDAVLARIETVDRTCNGFRFVDAVGARAQALAAERRYRAGTPLGPLDGVPTSVKDIVNVEGWSTRHGSLTTADTPADEDAPAVAHLRAAGAVLLGMTTTPEFGWKAVTDSPLTGITRNPWNPERTPGGSSGGAAVAAATGCGPLHIGTDGGGSIRIPCSFTGIVGIKPTFGRVPAHPLSFFGTVSHLGPMTRSVEDAAAMLAVMSQPDPRDWHQSWAAAVDAAALDGDLRGLRIGIWSTPPSGEVAAEVASGFHRALAVLTDLGAEVVPVSLPQDGLYEVFRVHWYAGAAQRLRAVDAARRDRIDPGFGDIARAGARLTLDDFMDASRARAAFGAAVEGLFAAEIDLMVSPTTALTAFEAGLELPAESNLERWIQWAGFSYPINLTQQPACSVPAGFDGDGLPIGLQLIGPKGADEAVLGAALAFERATRGGLDL
ncbi:MAG: amidase [Geminicoccaceae bacterium]|nr:MAG: amidase [Geminicoccaceae bacterium]